MDIDLMEYATDGAAQAAYVTDALTNISNGDLIDEVFSNLDAWTLDAATQETFDSKSCVKIDSGAITNNSGSIRQYGTFSTRTVISLNLYCDTLGTLASGNVPQLSATDGTTYFLAVFCSDGLFIYNGSSFVEAGTNIVSADTWQEWTFDVNWSTKKVDVYLNKTLVTSQMSCNYTAYLSSKIVFYSWGVTTTHRICYLDWLKAGTELLASLQSYSESTIKSQGSYSLKGVAAITDSLNKSLTRTFS